MSKNISKNNISKKIIALLLITVLFIFVMQNNNNKSEVLSLAQSDIIALDNSRSCYNEISCNYNADGESGTLQKKLFGLLALESTKFEIVPERYVFLGGFPAGFMLDTVGALVVGFGEVEGELYNVSPNEKILKKGDIIMELNGNTINDIDDIPKIVATLEKNSDLTAVILRNGKKINLNLTYTKDKISKKNKLGLWVKENVAGLGMVSFVKIDGGFCALGHPICDKETNTIYPVEKGEVYDCKIVGIEPAKRGQAGELKGMFVSTNKKIGNINTNDKFGLYGTIDDTSKLGEFYKLANRKTVKVGKAKLVTSIDNARDAYDIEIIKADTQNTANDKGIVIRITDKRLLSKTGGIVQGMSGSPILQNGRIVGALTHVFINDSTVGYGMYADFMYEKIA